MMMMLHILPIALAATIVALAAVSAADSASASWHGDASHMVPMGLGSVSAVDSASASTYLRYPPFPMFGP
jgi:hypothetical protein